MGMIPGCSSLADVRASRWNRSTNSLSKASENGRTLMATSRSSCFSRALKTIAMPPRPSSSRISYSSFSCSRTSSGSVSSCGVWIGVATSSKPQGRQNLLVSSFWVPQREQYIHSPRDAETYGRVGAGVNRLARHDDELAAPHQRRGRRRIAHLEGEDVAPFRRVAQVDGAAHPGHRPVGGRVELEQHGCLSPAEQPVKQRAPSFPLEPDDRVIRRPGGEPVHLVIQLGRTALRKMAER